MDHSNVMRRSVATIVKRSRSSRRRAPFVWTLILAVLAWGLIIWAGFAVSAWLT